MSTIQPFAAIRYSTSQNADLSPRLSPPYDVLDEREKQGLLAADHKNFVKLDLPHVPATSAGPDAAYAASRSTLDAWLADGTLTRDTAPAIYVYHQRFRHGDRDFVRKMFFARLRLEPFGQGSVFPHERTFGGPKEDRLCLTQATQANLSPIFGLYQDAQNIVAGELERGLPTQPIAHGTLGGVANRLWAVTAPATISSVARLMTEKPTYIADGHHRYGTSLLYQEWLERERGPLPAEHPANFVLCVFCAMEDPGLLILPTHRVLPGVAVTAELLRAERAVQITPLRAASAEQAVAQLATHGPQAVGLVSAQDEAYYALQPAPPELLRQYEPQRSDAWRKLALAFLHAYIIDRVVTPKLARGTAPEIRYIKNAAEAVALARSTGGSAFLMQPTTMEELRAVCCANDLMPQKSTFFYPKLASGLVVNPLAP